MIKQSLNQIDAYIILSTCVLLIVSCVLLNLSLVYGFAISIVLSCFIFFMKGFSIRKLANMMLSGLNECKTIYILILLIGANVSIWLSSGVVPSMIYYGSKYMSGINFLFAAFLITAISSIFMGTAIGTVSTIGLAILGIGKGFGIPTNVLLGAVVSGAFVADKISPISGLLNLTLSSTNTNYKETLKTMLVTLIPTLILSSAIYYCIGIKYSINNNSVSVLKFQKIIKISFFISPYLLLIPVLLVILCLIGLKIVDSISIGLFGGIIISFYFQKITIIKIISSILWGYKGNTPSIKLNEILISGGVVSMFEVLLIVMCAIALSSILEGTGLINYITDKTILKIESKEDLIIKTGLISGILTAITCDQTMGIVLPGKLLKNKYNELNVSRTILARTISDTGTIIAPLMPWNVNCLVIKLVAVTTVSYSPFAVLCYISPMITFAYGFLQKKLKNKS